MTLNYNNSKLYTKQLGTRTSKSGIQKSQFKFWKSAVICRKLFLY